MSINSIKNKLDSLTKKTEAIADEDYVSVVHVDEDGNWHVPEGKIPRPTGVLVAPLPVTIEEWLEQGEKLNAQNQQSDES